MFKQKIILLLFLLVTIYHNAFALITESINFTMFENYNSSGIIVKKDYKSDLNVFSNKVSVYNYFDKVNFPASADDMHYSHSYNEFEELLIWLSKEVTHSFVLIPRNPDFDINNYNNEDALNRMESFIAKNSVNTDFSDDMNFNQVANLASKFDCNQEFIPMIKKALNGSYGLFVPEEFDIINKFQGQDRVLSLAITPINQLFINSSFFNNPHTITNIQDLKELQFFLLQQAKDVQTVLFVPEYASHISTIGNLTPILFPVALIEKVSYDADQNICLTLKCLKPNRSIYYSMRRFNDVKNNAESTSNELKEELIYLSYKIKFNKIKNDTINTSNYNRKNTQQAQVTSFSFDFLKEAIN
jgi:hypothetical protein